MKLTRDEKRFLRAVETMTKTGENFMYAGVSAHSGLRYDDRLRVLEKSLLRKGALNASDVLARRAA